MVVYLSVAVVAEQTAVSRGVVVRLQRDTDDLASSTDQAVALDEHVAEALLLGSVPAT
jgi:hypothetical protein